MKRLVVHIGYPKTATTTLQVNVFEELYKRGEIEYLNHIGNSNGNVGKIIYKNTFDYIVGIADKLDINELKNIREIKNKITILSNESISHVSKKSPTASYKIGSLDNIKKIHEVFSPYFEDIQIIMTIRAQKSIIPSYYTQEYFNILQDVTKLNDIGKWIDENFNYSIDDNLLIFNYLSMYKEVSKYFKQSHIHVLIYEDLKNNKVNFFKDLSKIIGFNSRDLQLMFDEKPQNVTLLDNKGLKVTDIQNLRTILTVIALKYNVPKPIRIFFKNILPSVFLNKQTKVKKEIRELTKNEIEFIYNRFKNINIELFNILGKDINIMKKYGY